MIARLSPNRVRRTYLGGSRIDAFTDVSADLSDGMTRPEDWTASTVAAFNGTEEVGGEGLGRLQDGRFVKDAAGELPILVKLLDSDERLVIQAHPTVECAKRLFGSPVGKTECWYFLPGTAPDACVYLGFKPGVSREKWERAVWDFNGQEQETRSAGVAGSASRNPALHVGNPLLEMLHRIPVKPGDFVFVDGGMPHAIGAGCFMIELQEPSDLMVVAERFTPSGRRIPDEKMHGCVGWNAMFDVYGYDGLEYGEICRRYVKRAVGEPCICGRDFTDKFEMWRLNGGDSMRLDGAAAVAIAVDGAGSVNGFAAEKGARIAVFGEPEILVEGSLVLVVCFKQLSQLQLSL